MPPSISNSSFSTLNPYLQLALDSTSLGAFKKCPRYYQLAIIEGYTPYLESVHLTWGLLAHATIEHYHHHKFAGATHQESLEKSIHWLLSSTWKDGRPWTSNHPTKNRLTLVRSMVWYLDKFGPSDPIETIQLSNGHPAVELSFRFDSQLRTLSTDEPILICGHMDRIGKFHGAAKVVDLKSTSHALDQKWYSQFTPHNQFSIYILAGRIVYNIPLNDIIVDGVQALANKSVFDRQIITRSDFQLDEFLDSFKFYARQMEQCATDCGSKNWPQNDKSCDLFGGCEFREICSQKSKLSQDQLLAAKFKRRVWDPLQTRGDI